MLMLRVIYVILLAVLLVLTALTVFHPVTVDAEYSEVQREQLLKAEDEWIIQFDIINHEGREANYTLTAVVGDDRYTEGFAISDGGKYSYIRHIPCGMTYERSINFSLYKDGEPNPIKQVTYHLEEAN